MIASAVAARRVHPVRVLTNTRWFAGREMHGRGVEAAPVPPGGPLADLRAFLRARHWDAVVLNIDTRRLLTFCLLKKLLGGRCRLVSVDIVLPSPRTWRERLAARAKGWMLRETDLFLCYFRATGPLAQAYGLDPRRIAYVPFKINNYAIVAAMQPRDEGFALVCGRTDRDYRTLAEAVRGTGVEVVILEYAGADRGRHGSPVEGVDLPANVRVVPHDGTRETWLDWISRAGFVVLPIVPGILKPAGISTYLEAMGLGKCVVITDSAATAGLVDGGQAVLVPPGDAPALRDAILRVAGDPHLRTTVAAAGRAYALSLGDESRLAADVARHVKALVGRA